MNPKLVLATVLLVSVFFLLTDTVQSCGYFTARILNDEVCALLVDNPNADGSVSVVCYYNGVYRADAYYLTCNANVAGTFQATWSSVTQIVSYDAPWGQSDFTPTLTSGNGSDGEYKACAFSNCPANCLSGMTTTCIPS